MVLGSGIREPRSGIRDPEKTYSGSRMSKSTRSRIRIRDTAIFDHNIPGSGMDPDPDWIRMQIGSRSVFSIKSWIRILPDEYGSETLAKNVFAVAARARR